MNKKKQKVRLHPVRYARSDTPVMPIELELPMAVQDNVNHPHHYKRGDVECISAVDAATTDMPGTYAHYTATIITYLWRWWFKNGVEDLKKARWYLNRLINKLDPNDKGV